MTEGTLCLPKPAGNSAWATVPELCPHPGNLAGGCCSAPCTDTIPMDLAYPAPVPARALQPSRHRHFLLTQVLKRSQSLRDTMSQPGGYPRSQQAVPSTTGHPLPPGAGSPPTSGRLLGAGMRGGPAKLLAGWDTKLNPSWTHSTQASRLGERECPSPRVARGRACLLPGREVCYARNSLQPVGLSGGWELPARFPCTRSSMAQGTLPISGSARHLNSSGAQCKSPAGPAGMTGGWAQTARGLCCGARSTTIFWSWSQETQDELLPWSPSSAPCVQGAQIPMAPLLGGNGPSPTHTYHRAGQGPSFQSPSLLYLAALPGAAFRSVPWVPSRDLPTQVTCCLAAIRGHQPPLLKVQAGSQCPTQPAPCPSSPQPGQTHCVAWTDTQWPRGTWWDWTTSRPVLCPAGCVGEWRMLGFGSNDKEQAKDGCQELLPCPPRAAQHLPFQAAVNLAKSSLNFLCLSGPQN